MHNWKSVAAVLMIPALLCLSSCGGAGGVSGAASGGAGATAAAPEQEQAAAAPEQEQAAAQESDTGATGAAAGDAEQEKQSFDGNLHFENGMAQPMLNHATYDVPNEESEIQHLCVYVETDHDTDGDGKADLVKAFVQIPTSAVEGQYKAAVIYDPVPYPAGTYKETEGYKSYPCAEDEFDYNKLYAEGAKREASERISTKDAAAKADMSEWDYSLAGSQDAGYYDMARYNYYLDRGFAIVQACGIGTYGSEGYELCGTDLERDSHKCVVEWLTGDRRAFTDTVSDIEIRADWCNGSIAMTGTSYGGTIPFEVAVTGVKGLKTIIPFAGIANWYDYTNSQGIALRITNNYTEYLAATNAGGTFLDDNWEKPNPEYCSWLWTTATEEDKANGDYTPFWRERDYTTDEENHIECSALLVFGLNDMNVCTRHAEMMFDTFRKAGKTVKMVLHQDGHNSMDAMSVNGRVWEDIMNEWLSHYLYGVDNDAESLPTVMAQNNTDGVFEAYPDWPGPDVLSLKTDRTEPTTTVSSENMGLFSLGFQDDHQAGLNSENQAEFYASMPESLAASYRFDLPAGTTIQGTPELHVKLDSSREDLDGLMITAVLMELRPTTEE